MRWLGSSESSRSPLGATLLGGMVTVACWLPMFVTAALAVQLMEDLRFGVGALGLAISLTRASGAVVSPFLGRFADTLGATRSLRVAALAAAVASAGIAATADRWTVLVVWLVVSGCAGALGQPAANRLLARRVSPSRLGLAFGVKQSAPPVASMAAGLSVPLLALTLGWRWAFGAAALVAIAVAAAAGPIRTPRLAIPPADRQSFPDHGRVASRRLIILLAVAFGLGTASSSMLTTFYVESAVRQGSSPAFAGTMLAVASATAIVVRVGAGAVSDRLTTTHLALCAGLVSFGALGLAMLSTGEPTLMAIGVVIAAGGVWSINGVFWFALVRGFPMMPGRITGAIAPGPLLGGTAGPLAFGLVVEEFGASVAWWLATATGILGAVFMLVAYHFLKRHLEGRSAPTAT